jgi:hypothetical protein
MSDLVRVDPRAFVSQKVPRVNRFRTPLRVPACLTVPMVFNTAGCPDVVARTLLCATRPILLPCSHHATLPQLQDSNGAVIAFYQSTRPTRYQVGDVYGELHFVRSAGAGTVVSGVHQLCGGHVDIRTKMHPPMMDIVTVTCMLYRFCALFNL